MDSGWGISTQRAQRAQRTPKSITRIAAGTNIFEKGLSVLCALCVLCTLCVEIPRSQPLHTGSRSRFPENP